MLVFYILMDYSVLIFWSILVKDVEGKNERKLILFSNNMNRIWNENKWNRMLIIYDK